MNEYIKHNLETKGDNDLTEKAFDGLCRFKCVSCGTFVSPATVKFYDFRIEDVKCYTCQANNK